MQWKEQTYAVSVSYIILFVVMQVNYWIENIKLLKYTFL